MGIPDVSVVVKDGGLGSLPANTSKNFLKVGVCSGGVVGQMYSFSDIGTLVSVLGQGPLVEAAAVHLAVAGGPVFCWPINPSTAGSVGSVTHTGSGAATVVPSAAPAQAISVTIPVGGALGTMQATFTVGNGTPFTVTSAAGWASGYQIPGTLTVATFPAGTYNTNNTYTFSTTSTTVTAGGTTPPAVTQVSSPLDAYNVIVVYTTAGAPGTGAFKYSLDGGNNYSSAIAIPGGGVYAIANAGFFLTFSGSGVTTPTPDTYTFTTTTASYTNTDVTNAFNTSGILQNSQAWSVVHLVGAPSTAANAAATAAVLSTQMTNAFNQWRFVRSIMECPTSESDSVVAAAFTNFSDPRVAVAAGDFACVSPISGRILRRNAAWIVAARLAAVNAGQDAADVSLGALPTVQSLYRDEQMTQALDAARFCTLRTIIGKQGYYITNARTMAAAGSDFTYMALCRVMDQACLIGRAALLGFLNSSVRVNLSTAPNPGAIDERDAQRIERSVNAQLKAGVVDTQDCTQALCQLSRTNNILTTNTEPSVIAIVPKGYIRGETVTVGFNNPALAS